MSANHISRELLQRSKPKLQEAFGDRLKGVVLHGSEARGEAGKDSDIDLLVLLEPPISLWRDISTIVRALNPIQLEILRPIHAAPVDINVFHEGEYPLYVNAQQDGVFI